MPGQQDQFIAKPRQPFTYMGVANFLMPGIKTLTTHGNLSTQTLPLAMLCAHALECGLKPFALGMEMALILESEYPAQYLQALRGGLKKRLVIPMPDWARMPAEIHVGPSYHLCYPKVHV